MTTFFHGKAAQVFATDIGGTERELTAYVNSQGLDRTADTAETSTFADDDKTFVVGLRDNKMNIDGFVDATVDGYLNGLIGSSGTVKIFPAGSVAGRPYYSATVAILTSHKTTSDIGDAVKFSAEWQISGSITRGTI